MSSDDKVDIKTVKEELPLDQLADKRGTLPEKYDLDKNPIKYRQYDGSLSAQAHDKDYMELILRSGKHSDLVKKLLRQKIEARAQDFPRWAGDMAGGVRSVWIESRFWYDRERFSPAFDDDWRKYRARYLHSLELDPSEPLYDVPEYHKSLINPIRRFYMKGGDWIEKHVIQKFTNDRHTSSRWRICCTRPWLIYFTLTLVYYRFRYINQTWEERHGQDYVVGSPRVYPGDPNWPWKDPRTNPWHHHDQGFLSRSIYKDLRDYEDITNIL